MRGRRNSSSQTLLDGISISFDRHGLLNRVLLRQSQGRRSRGRTRTSWTVKIFEWTGLSYGEGVRRANCRSEWRIVAQTLSQRTEHNDYDDFYITEWLPIHAFMFPMTGWEFLNLYLLSLFKCIDIFSEIYFLQPASCFPETFKHNCYYQWYN